MRSVDSTPYPTADDDDGIIAVRHLPDLKYAARYPLGHVLESHADNKLNSGVCQHCNRWFGRKLGQHIEETAACGAADGGTARP